MLKNGASCRVRQLLSLFTLLSGSLAFCQGAMTVAATNQSSEKVVSINAGGGAAGTWSADEYYAGGTSASTSATVNTSLLANPAPQSIYQTERYADTTYTIPNLTPASTSTVNLHFAETYWNGPRRRLFNVAINGTPVLSNFDIFATAGGRNIAIVESFTATASSAGTITIAFTTGAADLPTINGIQILTAAAASSPAFTLSASSASLSLSQAGAITSAISVIGAGGFTGSVTLAASGLPSGVTASFATNPTTGSSVLTLNATSTAATGTFTINITGTSGSLTSSVPIALAVSALAGYTLAASPNSLPITQGGQTSSTISVVAAGGFTGSVTLAWISHR